MKSVRDDLPHPLPDWHCDFYSNTLGVTIQVDEILFHEVTEFQDIKICQTQDFGRTLLLNNFIYRGENLNFAVPEMLAHVPMRTGFEKQRVLLIGGGDGYTAGELTKYANLSIIDVVDIDGRVVHACREYFPVATAAFNNPRVKVYIQDGYDFVKRASNKCYDLILVTGTEGENLDGSPGLSYGLFQPDFFRECHRCLSDEGLLLVDASTVYFDISSFNYAYLTAHLGQLFDVVKTNLLVSGTLLSGLFAMTLASKKFDPETDILSGYDDIETRYYNRRIHSGSFALPQLMYDKIASYKS